MMANGVAIHTSARKENPGLEVLFPNSFISGVLAKAVDFSHEQNFTPVRFKELSYLVYFSV